LFYFLDYHTSRLLYPEINYIFVFTPLNVSSFADLPCALALAVACAFAFEPPYPYVWASAFAIAEAEPPPFADADDEADDEEKPPPSERGPRLSPPPKLWALALLLAVAWLSEFFGLRIFNGSSRLPTVPPTKSRIRPSHNI